MSYQQIRDILKQVAVRQKTFHTRVFHVIATIERKESHQGIIELPRREWLIKYIESQADAVRDALSRPAKDGESNVLDTWLQYVPDEDVRREYEELQSNHDLDWSELRRRIQRFDEALRDFYFALAEQSAAQEVRELFDTLAKRCQYLLEQTSWGSRSATTPVSEDRVDEV